MIPRMRDAEPALTYQRDPAKRDAVNGLRRRILICGLFFSACSFSPHVPKGQLTIQGKGAEALTNDGDPLLSSGTNIRKVPVEFAKGYTKGISDQVKRNYWMQQQNQQTSKTDQEGHIRYYNATIPEHEDFQGITRVQREVVIPIVE
jgi:hypothetical protein